MRQRICAYASFRQVQYTLTYFTRVSSKVSDCAMDTIAIIKALLDQGMKQDAIGEAVDVSQATISRWLNGGTVDLKARNLDRLHKLALERGVITESASKAPPSEVSSLIDEIDVRGGMGGGGLSVVENTATNGISFHREVVRDHWRLPDWMLNRFNVKAHHVKAFPAQGDSMMPTIADGDVVFADTRHRVPSPPGIYVLADEFGGVVIKRLEIISKPKDETIIVRISSDNPHHSSRDLTLDEIHIIGRYMGRFTV